MMNSKLWIEGNEKNTLFLPYFLFELLAAPQAFPLFLFP